jgi:murein DD-endopeptidase MepM/ murein hydrolase activator NlpD
MAKTHMGIKTPIRLLCLIFLAPIFWLASCQPSYTKPEVTVQNDQTEPTAQPAEEDEISLSGSEQPTSMIEGESLNNPAVSSIMTITPDALRFIFPTPPLSSVSAWRPPLYPTPWVPTPYDHFYFARPIAANEINWPLANYRYGGVFFGDEVHTGIDIPVKVGTPIYAAGPGRINWAGYGLYSGSTENQDDPYGMAVVIRHDFGYQGQTLFTVYGHMSRIDVKRGEEVDTGDMLGLSGATGNVTGPHLHFEVRIGKNNFSRSRNPELWLSPPQGWGILAGKVMDDKANYMPRQEVIIESRDTGEKYSVKTYGIGAANPDPYYKENMVIGDLPAGNYTVWVPEIKSTKIDIKIYAGRVSFFSLYGSLTFNTNLPPTPGLLFQTPVVEPSLTP